MAFRHAAPAQWTFLGTFWGTLLVAAALAGAVVAKPLDKAACKTLLARETTLVAAGVEADMTKGPGSNPAPERLERIKTYIDVEEQLLFRCGFAARRYKAFMRKQTAAKRAATGKRASGTRTSAATGNSAVVPASGITAPRRGRSAAVRKARTDRSNRHAGRRAPAPAPRKAALNPFHASDLSP